MLDHHKNEPRYQTAQRKAQSLENNAGKELLDNRPRSITQLKQVEAMANGLSVQRKANNTGLSDKLKSGVESLSGHSMDDVKVHYNSTKPAQLNAHAYAQGTDIHIASGQEKHLPHEAWHVVQQKQGRVKPMVQMKGKVNVNDDKGLEKEADIMGAKAMQRNVNPVDEPFQKTSTSGEGTVQRVESLLAFLKGAAISTLKAPARIVKRTLNVVKHVTWDLGRAVYQKGKNIAAGAAVHPASFMDQVAAADPAFNSALTRQEMIDVRRSSDALTKLGIAFHFMANGVANIPPMYNNPLTVVGIAPINGRLTTLRNSINNAAANIPPVNPLHGQLATIVNHLAAAILQNINFRGAVNAAIAGPGLVANAAAIRNHVILLQNEMSEVQRLLIQPAPGGLMQEKAPVWNWLFGLLTKTLDVTGLKELIQQLTSLGGAVTFSQLRDMNVDERALAQQIYGSSLHISDMQLLENSHLPAGLVGGGGAFIVANTIHTRTAFANPADSVEDTKQKGVLMHEVLHNAQEQKQGMLSWIELQWGRGAAEQKNPHTWIPQYDYGTIDVNSRLRDFTREQQGAVVQDYSTFMEMHRKAGTAPVAADMIHGDHGSGSYQHYQAALGGLTHGHWASPKQSEQWKAALG